MTKGAYYNEIDAHAAAWLRNLIKEGLIADGDVDTRSVRDICPGDLAGYTQVHLFAGIGLWSLALRWADWGDDRAVWTASCPCQPFSSAGRGDGFDDERHLWPAAFWLIEQCRPAVIVGEQVESEDGLMWLDLVFSDLEGIGYPCGAADFPSAGVGAPNLRQRLFWVADARSGRRHQQQRERREQGSAGFGRHQLQHGGEVVGLAHPEGRGRGEHRLLGEAAGGGEDTGPSALGDEDAGSMGNAKILGSPARACEPDDGHSQDQLERSGDVGRLGHPGHPGLSDPESRDLRGQIGHNQGRAAQQPDGPRHPWRELEWLGCLDGRWRPTQPGIFPLAPRHPGDVAKLRAYGNAINPVAAAEVIRAYMEASCG